MSARTRERAPSQPMRRLPETDVPSVKLALMPAVLGPGAEMEESVLDHYDGLVRRFGTFPHRNKMHGVTIVNQNKRNEVS